MKLLSVFLFLVVLIKITRAKNLLDIVLENSNINRNFSKTPKSTFCIVAKTGTTGSFPRLPNRGTELDLNPPIETYSQATKIEQNEKLLMGKLTIKDKNFRDNNKVQIEVTTKRSLMPTKFTVKPSDVHPESGSENHNWNSNKRNIYNLNIPEKQYCPNSYVDYGGSRKSKTTLVFPKRDNTEYFKKNPEQGFFKTIQIDNFVSQSKVNLNMVNISNSMIIKEKQNIIVPLNVQIKLESKEQIVQMIEASENFSERAELISVTEGYGISLVVPDGADDDEMATDSVIEYLVSRPERSVNIIEEENVASTFFGVTVTNQDYPGHDLTFKNIHS